MVSNHIKRFTGGATIGLKSALSAALGLKLGSTKAANSKSKETQDQSVLGDDDHLLSHQEDPTTANENKLTLIYFYQTERGADTDQKPVSSVVCPDGTTRSVYQTKDNGATLYGNNSKSNGTAAFSAQSLESAELFNDELEARMKAHCIAGIKGTELEEFPPDSDVYDRLFALTLKEKEQTPDALYKWIREQHKSLGSMKDDFEVDFAKDLHDFLNRVEEYTDVDSAQSDQKLNST